MAVLLGMYFAWEPLVLARALLVILIGVTPARAAVDAENPLAPDRAPVEETGEPAASPRRSEGTPLVLPERYRDTAIYCVGGAATPVGVIGVEAVRRFGPLFELSAGFGVGFAAADSEPHAGFGHVVQWTLMPRLRLGNDRSAFTMGAGASGGNYGDIPLCVDGPCSSNPTYPVSYFVWSNFEIGVEYWSSGGFALRFFAGYAHGWCTSSSCISAADNLPYFGWGLGYAF